jgi:intein/homing endonuclease
MSTTNNGSRDLVYGVSILMNFLGIGTAFSEKGNEHKEKLCVNIVGNEDDSYPLDRDVYFDKIVEIKHVESSTEFVYDFTVEETLNFQIFNGLNVRD